MGRGRTTSIWSLAASGVPFYSRFAYILHIFNLKLLPVKLFYILFLQNITNIGIQPILFAGQSSSRINYLLTFNVNLNEERITRTQHTQKNLLLRINFMIFISLCVHLYKR